MPVVLVLATPMVMPMGGANGDPDCEANPISMAGAKGDDKGRCQWVIPVVMLLGGACG